MSPTQLPREEPLFGEPLPVDQEEVGPVSGGKEGRSFTFYRESTGANLLVEDFTFSSDLEDTCLAGDECDFFGSHGPDFSRHTVSFGEVVSLSAIFDLDHWCDKLDRFPIFANDFVRT